MAATYDAIVIGGGHNGLVTAAYLGRAGRKVLVLERRERLGGAAVTEEIFPGFKFSMFSYVVSLLRPEIIRDLDLPGHGLHILPLESTVTPMTNGDYFGAWSDHDQTRAELVRHSRKDAEAYDEYGRLMYQMAHAVRPILGMVPPDPTSMNPRDLMGLLKVGKHFRDLGADQFHALHKLMTMSSADFLDEWFETDVLKATKSASGIIGTFLGPRSPGTAYVLLHHYMGELDGVFRAWGFAKGGTGSVSETIGAAARRFGAEIRASSPVTRVLVKNGRAVGVVLENGDEIRARTVLSSLDPHRTFLQMVEAKELPDDFLGDIKRFTFRGSSGKVNLALGALPSFTCLPGFGPHLRGAMSISPSLEYVERAYDDAKYGEFSREPYMDIVIPSLIDPGMAPPGKHVMSIFVQYAPYRLNGGWTDAKREAFGDAVINALERFAPNIRSCIEHRQVLTPLDIERITGLTEGNIFAGELSLNQLFFLRPAAGYAQYRTPISGYYQCGSGTHPGGGIMGASGRLAALAALGRRRMSSTMSYDVIVIGAGTNGLVTAHLLARAGRKVLVLEQSAGEPASRDTGWIPPQVISDLSLTGAGLVIDAADPWAAIALEGGSRLELSANLQRSAEAIASLSPRDAAKWPEFCGRMHKVASVLAALYTQPAPDVETTEPGELLRLGLLGLKVKGLGRQGMIDLMRLLPMSVADLLDEWFENDALKAALGIAGVMHLRQGPRSGGTAFNFLHHHVGSAPGVFRLSTSNLGAVLAGLPGVEVRRGIKVARIRVAKGRASGVVLANGDELAASLVISSADPRATLLGLLEPGWLDPGFIRAVGNIKCRGIAAQVNLTLANDPPFQTLSVAPSLTYMERAYDDVKYGRVSANPWLEARAFGRNVEMHVQYVPHTMKDGSAVADLAVQQLCEQVPGLRESITSRAVLTPADLAAQGLTEGQRYHGELTLDQILFMRPVPGWTRYGTPISGLYLCGAGTHPGGGIAGGPGRLAAREILSRFRNT